MENMMNSDHKDNQNSNWQDNYDRIFKKRNKQDKAKWRKENGGGGKKK